MMLRVCQFTEILWCPEYVNLQRFCRDFMVPRVFPICRDFVVFRVCQFTKILQRFYGAPSFSDLKIFYGALSVSIYKDFTMLYDPGKTRIRYL